jgi:peptidoglycan/xylan/chitin deacetylase (PgdA/CDA1 family)
MQIHLFREETGSEMRIPVLMYHEVSDVPQKKMKYRHMHPSYSLSVSQFADQMEYLFKNDYKSLSLNSLFNRDCRPEKTVVITFDDGFSGNFEYAFPILNKYNYSATVFVIVQQISSEKYMNWYQLKELSHNGISIQSHTMTHRPLGQLHDNEVYYELSESKKIIEDKIGCQVKYLSLPHGSCHHKLIHIAREVGYSGICGSTFEYVNLHKIQFIIGRIPIKKKYRMNAFKQIICEHRFRILKYRLFELSTRSLCKMIGLNNYRKVYRFIFHIKI